MQPLPFRKPRFLKGVNANFFFQMRILENSAAQVVGAFHQHWAYQMRVMHSHVFGICEPDLLVCLYTSVCTCVVRNCSDIGMAVVILGVPDPMALLYTSSLHLLKIPVLTVATAGWNENSG